MAKDKNRTDLIVGVLVGAVIVLGFFAFTQQYGFGYKTAPTGIHGINMPNSMMGSMMMPMMQNTMHADANSDGKCDMCGMSIETCRTMMSGY